MKKWHVNSKVFIISFLLINIYFFQSNLYAVRPKLAPLTEVQPRGVFDDFHFEKVWPSDKPQKLLLDFEQRNFNDERPDCGFEPYQRRGSLGKLYSFDSSCLKEEVLRALGLNPGTEYLIKVVNHTGYLTKLISLLEASFEDYAALALEDLSRRANLLDRLPLSPNLMRVVRYEWQVNSDDLLEISLFEKIRSHADIPPELLAQSLVGALQALSARGIVHGDVHEANIIAGLGVGVLIDFDILYDMREQTRQQDLTVFDFSNPLAAPFRDLCQQYPQKRHQVRAALQVEYLLKKWLRGDYWKELIEAVKIDMLGDGKVQSWDYYFSKYFVSKKREAELKSIRMRVPPSLSVLRRRAFSLVHR